MSLMAWEVETDRLAGITPDECLDEIQARFVKDDKTLDLIFRNVPLTVYWSYEKGGGLRSSLWIKYPATFMKDEPANCLELCYLLEEASIYQIYAGKAVPAHIEKKGTWLMHLALAIFAALQMKTITLEDRAGFQNYGSLKFLRLFQGKRASWYRSFGFVAKNHMYGADSVEQEKQLYNYPLAELRRYIPDPGPFTILGPYMLDLSQKDISRYRKLLKILPNLKDLADLFFEIKHIDSLMIKQ